MLNNRRLIQLSIHKQLTQVLQPENQRVSSRKHTQAIEGEQINFKSIIIYSLLF